MKVSCRYINHFWLIRSSPAPFSGFLVILSVAGFLSNRLVPPLNFLFLVHVCCVPGYALRFESLFGL